MTKLPDDVVREIEKANHEQGHWGCETGDRAAINFKEGAEFGFKLSQAKAMKLVEALREANELCRSAFQICSRNGNETNWDGFQKQLRKGLDQQFEALSTFKQETTPREDER